MAMPAEDMPQVIEYPESDGLPMGESDLHIELLAELFTGLRAHLREVPDLYVGGDLIVYYQEGKPSQKVVPDIFAARGVGRHPRKSWLMWKEGKGPEFVLELLSDSSYIEDQGNKKVLYAQLGVQEYFLFDPQGCYLKPALVGYRLVDGDWQRLAGTRLRSEVLGVDFYLEEDTLRLADARTGEVILRRGEIAEARRHEAGARLSEVEALRAENERLRAELERRGGKGDFDA